MTKFNDLVANRVVKAVRRGAFLDRAANEVGVHRSTIYDWLQKGEADDPPDEHQAYVDFALAFRAAEAHFERVQVSKILRGGKSWKAKAWYLERRHPTRYGKRKVLEHTGPDGGPMQHHHSGAVIFFPEPDPPDDAGLGSSSESGGAGVGPIPQP